MILRQPTTLDVVKIANVMCPNEPEEQAEFVALWLQKQQESNFIDLVAVHKKKLAGFIAGTLEGTHLGVVWMKAETTTILHDLWVKVKKTHEFETAGISTTDPTIFETLGFKPHFTVMRYEGSDSQ
jgi:hypothetical protein